MARYYQSLLLAFASGIILGLAHPPTNMGILVWVGFIPLLFALYKGAKTRKHAFFLGTLTGTIYYGIVMYWLWSANLVELIGVQTKLTSNLIILPIWFFSALGMGIFYGFFALIFWRLIRLGNHATSLKTVLLLSAATGGLFILLDYASAYGFGLLWYGPGSLLGAHWTLGHLAYSLAENKLALLIARYLGSYGVAFLILFINTFIFFSLVLYRKEKTHIARLLIIAIAVIAIPAVIPLNIRTGNRQLNFAIIQTSDPSKNENTTSEILDQFNRQLSLVKEVGEEYPETDIIVLPEASDFLQNLSLFLNQEEAEKYFIKTFKKPTLIISSIRAQESDGTFRSRVFSLDSNEGVIGMYDKQLLTPIGEYLSYTISTITNLFSNNLVNEFEQIREYSVGSNPISKIKFHDKFTLASLVCSEIFSPSLTTKTIDQADIVAVLNSNSVFNGSSSVTYQQRAATIFRAAENGKPFIVANNMGLSYAIDGTGLINASTKTLDAQLLTGAVEITTGRTWYNILGDLPILIISGCLLGVLLFKQIYGKQI
ncbi:MAG: nitrilase-related carbon-nitrogen hydrolase [Parcubacteria group bacterium]